MSPAIPAEAARMKALLPYPAYRVWWISNVNRLPVQKPEPGALPLADAEEG